MKKTHLYLFSLFSCFGLKVNGQCPAPVLIANNTDLCSGSPTTFTAIFNLPTGCVLAAGTPYTFTVRGRGYPTMTNALPFNAPDAGTYLVTVRLENAPGQTCPCVGTTPPSNPLEVKQTPTTPILATPNPVICGGNTILRKAANHVVNGTLLWTDASGANMLHQGSEFTTPALVSDGIFRAQELHNGCKSALSPAVTVTVNPLPPPTLETVDTTICVNKTVTLGASNSVVGTTTKWYGEPNGNPLVHIGDRFITPPASATTRYWAESNYGICASRKSEVQVRASAAPTISILETNKRICEGESFRLNAKLDTNIVRYDWTGPSGFRQSGNSIILDSVKELLHRGIYRMTGVNRYGCLSNTAETPVDVLLKPRIHVTERFTIKDGESIQLNATGGDTYNWYPTLHLDNPNIANPFFTPPPMTHTIADTFSYKVNVTERGIGCVATGQTKIIVQSQDTFQLYNVITPNGDGKNDVWEIDYLYRLQNYTITIKNLQGDTVYENEGDYANNKWKGQNQFNGESLPDGMYWYIIRFKDGRKKPILGSIGILNSKD
jgi:gliding motility-associated-like protein